METTRNNMGGAAKTIIPTSVPFFVENDNLEYMVYTVEDRAIPSVKDGLKPSARRMLFSMFKDGVHPGKNSQKSSRLVGSATGRYHPHGDAAMYDVLVGLAVNHNRVKLVQGVGAFGAAPGVAPAQARYTEARLSPHGFDLVRDISEEVVEHQPNYDQTHTEPKHLTPSFPVLLVNGSTGIAEGYRTNVPAHNPRDVVRMCLEVLNNPGVDDDTLMGVLQGPDWGTGGCVVGGDRGFREYFTTGRGMLTVRGTYTLSKNTMTITEVPPEVLVPTLLEQLRDEARNGTIEGVRDVELLSDKNNPVKIVITVKRGVDVSTVAQQVLLRTKLESTFSANLLALDADRKVRLWTVRQLVDEFLLMREHVLLRKTQAKHQRNTAQLERAEALSKILVDKQLAVDTVMGSENEQQAAQRLAEVFGVTVEQGAYVADLPIRRLAKSSVLEAQQQVETLRAQAVELQQILNNSELRRELLAKQLRHTMKLFDDPHFDRKTTLSYNTPTTKQHISRNGGAGTKTGFAGWKLDADTGLLGDHGDTIPDGRVVFAAFTSGVVKTLNGKGLPSRVAPKTVASDLSSMVSCGSVNPETHTIILVSNSGKALKLDVSEQKIRPQGVTGNGVAGMKLGDGDSVVECVPVNDGTELLLRTTNGRVKVVRAANVGVHGRNTRGVVVCPLAPGEQIMAVVASDHGFICDGVTVKPSSLHVRPKPGLEDAAPAQPTL